MRKSTDSPVIALMVADLHLSGKPPVARSCEKDWIGVQRGYLRQLRQLQRDHANARTPPILIPGDIFDKPNVPHEVVNLALRELPPDVYAVPGNHDLPNHRLEDAGKSAYGTLVEAGKIIDLKPGHPVEIPGKNPIRLHGFPHGIEAEPLRNPSDLFIEVAVVHDYIWSKNSGTGYEGAPEGGRVHRQLKKLTGYDVAVYGDNHVPFYSFITSTGLRIHNCGAFMRRKSDERDHRPSVGLLRADGTIRRHYMDTSKDEFIEGDDLAVKALERTDDGRFIESLASLEDAGLNFRECVMTALLSDVDDQVKRRVLEAMEVENADGVRRSVG